MTSMVVRIRFFFFFYFIQSYSYLFLLPPCRYSSHRFTQLYATLSSKPSISITKESSSILINADNLKTNNNSILDFDSNIENNRNSTTDILLAGKNGTGLNLTAYTGGDISIILPYHNLFESTIEEEKKQKSDAYLEKRTVTCLDFQYILDALRNCTITSLGSEICGYKSCHSVESINTQYAMIDEISPQLGLVPIKSKMNIVPLLRSIEYNGSPPEVEDLSYFADTIQQINDLRSFILDKTSTNPNSRLPLYEDLAYSMTLPKSVKETFDEAFDDENNLNADKFPELGRLRNERDRLKIKILQTLQTVIKSDSMKDKLSDNGYFELDDRYCVMIKNTYKKGVGVVHGSSNTGRTLYVEPFEIVEPSNELREVKVQIRVEENRILFEMIKTIATYLSSIKSAIQAVAEVDVLMAKAKLGKLLKGVIPEVGNEGSMRVVRGRHPILLLRGVQPVENNIELSSQSSALVISGPNAGGKTVILKMAGLFALMVSHAIPIPAAQGARIDIMDVMADIGDMQTVNDDLSTFSGHLVICRKILEQIQTKLRPSLVLLDEIGTGTDPAQGAALAQAVLEELVNKGCRVIVTTHYQRIKELAAEDPRFRVAAMEFVDNRPTYRLRLGYVGESYALEAGRRMLIPENVLERANALLDDESRKIIALQKRLEEETEKSRELQKQLAQEINELSIREAEIENDRKKLEAEIKRIREGKMDEFLRDIKDKEREIEELFEKAREAATSQAANSILSGIGMNTKNERESSEKVVQNVKTALKEVRIETETQLIQQNAADLGTPLPSSGDPINEGTTLIVLERGNLFGKRAMVVQRNKGRGRVHVRIGAMEVKMERHQLGIPRMTGLLGSNNNGENNTPLSAKERRLMKMLEEELVDPDKMLSNMKKGSSFQSSSSFQSMGGLDSKSTRGMKITGMRTTSNTIDIRRCIQVSDCQKLFDKYLEEQIDKDIPNEIAYVHHSSSTTTEDIAMKTKFRAWLKLHPLVLRSYPAETNDGGDAFTIVELSLTED